MYFTVENGAASVMPSATSPVITSTLPAAQSSTATSSSAAAAQSSKASAGGQSNAASVNAVSVLQTAFVGLLGYLFL